MGKNGCYGFLQIAQNPDAEFCIFTKSNAKDGINQMTDDRYLLERMTEMQVAVAHTSAAISFLELQNGKLDRWEKICLIDAINGVFRSRYLIASNAAYLALTPEDERVPNSEIKWSIDHQEDKIDLAFLKNLFSIV